MLRAFLDESYDSGTMCVGGWLCREETWTWIEARWHQRIEHERRMSIRRGEPPISRYHATDCANLKREFSTWTIERQILLTKKLIDILGDARPRPVGIAAGLSLRELKAARPDLTDKHLKRLAYYLCMCECFINIAAAMDELFTTEQVTIIHDRTPDFDQAALSAFSDMFTSQRFAFAHYFVTIGPGGWEEFVALQAADLIAFEGFKLTASRKRGRDDLRKSLQKAIGRHLIIRAGFFKAKGLTELVGKRIEPLSGADE